MSDTRLSRTAELRAKPEGVIEVRAVTYMLVPDDYGSLWAPGVFTESLNEHMPAILWAHDGRSPIGRATGWRDDDDGPWITARIDNHADVPLGRQAVAQIQSGTITDVSVGFANAERRSLTDAERRIWPDGREVITKARLDEVSLVFLGAVPGAEVLALRSRVPAGAPERARALVEGRITPAQFRQWAQLDRRQDRALAALTDPEIRRLSRELDDAVDRARWRR